VSGPAGWLAAALGEGVAAGAGWQGVERAD